MKNLKNFPVVAAQQQILKAFSEILPVVEQVFEKYQKEGTIGTPEIFFSTYNSGYQIITGMKFNYNVFNERQEKVLDALSALSNIYLYPAAFYNEYIKECHGAEISGRIPISLKDGGSDTYKRFEIHNDSDMRAAVRKFKKETISRLNELLSL